MLRQLILVLILILTIVESRTTPKRRNFSIRLRQRAHNVKSPNSIKLHDAYGAKLHAKGESVLYEVKISLGETLQTIPVTISTTFSGLWVPQRGCANKAENSRFCPNQGAYDPNLSKISRKIRNGFKYDRVQTGNFRMDSFAFGTKKCEKQMLKLKSPIVFGAATQTVHGDQGLLGLGLPDSSQLTNVFEQMIKEDLLEAPIFTTMYKPCTEAGGCKKAGLLTLGGVDATFCEEVKGWTPVPDGAKHWSVTVSRWQINKFKYLRPSVAILDPTSTTIHLPDDLLNAVARQAGARFADNEYTIECDKEWSLQLQVGEHEMTIPGSKLVKSAGNDRCHLLLSKGIQWVLGAPFAQTYCVSHNLEKREIGFAKVK